MIGIGLGASGIIAGPVAGLMVQHLGFTVHYLVLAAIALLALIPIALIRDERAQPAKAAD